MNIDKPVAAIERIAHIKVMGLDTLYKSIIYGQHSECFRLNEKALQKILSKCIEIHVNITEDKL